MIVVCHNYGHFLGECLQSVLSQSRPADEVLVVDDRSTDNSREVAATFAEQGVHYLHVDHGNVHRTRESGFLKTESDYVCFLDADDLLPQDYLSGGLAEFAGAEATAIVYSDVRFFGERTGRSHYPDQFDQARLERDNYIHAGSLVRREAIELSQAFRDEIDPLVTQADWFLWRRVLETGWNARKQSALYAYRQHGANWMEQMGKQPESWFEYAGIGFETVTLFIALSGRENLWPTTARFLERQAWPKDQSRLVMIDTSQNEVFGGELRSWLLSSGYPDVRYITADVGAPGLADDNRRDHRVRNQVQRAVARVYNRLVTEATTPYVWVLEDDILPPDNVCEQLLKGFGPDVASVAGVYASRYDGQPCVWNEQHRPLPSRPSGVEDVYGNGFGCVILRGGVLRETVFRAPDDFDRTFYRQVHERGLTARVDWSVKCEHRNAVEDSQ